MEGAWMRMGKEASRGFEPRSLDSESRVLTVTPRGHCFADLNPNLATPKFWAECGFGRGRGQPKYLMFFWVSTCVVRQPIRRTRKPNLNVFLTCSNRTPKTWRQQPARNTFGDRSGTVRDNTGTVRGRLKTVRDSSRAVPDRSGSVRELIRATARGDGETMTDGGGNGG